MSRSEQGTLREERKQRLRIVGRRVAVLAHGRDRVVIARCDLLDQLDVQDAVLRLHRHVRRLVDGDEAAALALRQLWRVARPRVADEVLAEVERVEVALRPGAQEAHQQLDPGPLAVAARRVGH
eukprot:1106597-Alexandrium_andersonii.AAC.1